MTKDACKTKAPWFEVLAIIKNNIRIQSTKRLFRHQEVLYQVFVQLQKNQAHRNIQCRLHTSWKDTCITCAYYENIFER